MIDINGTVEFIHWLVFWTERTICKLGLFPLTQRCAEVAGCNCTPFHLSSSRETHCHYV